MARRITIMTGVAPRTVDLSDFAKKSDIPAPVDISDLAKKSDIPAVDKFATKDEVTQKIESAKGEILVTEDTRNQFIKDVVDNADNQIGARLNQLDTKYNDLEPRIKHCEEDLDNQVLINEELRKNGYLNVAYIMTTDNLRVYNNDGNGNVTIERRLNGKVNAPHVVVVATGVGSPDFGGVCHAFIPKPNTAYKVELTAQIPVGRTLNMKHSNFIDATHFTELTPMTGTGKFERYEVEIHAGANPTEGHSTGFYAIYGGDVPTVDNPLEWIITEANVQELPANWE